MPTIYHLVPRRIWEANPDQPYRADSLTTEGFIHCSFATQVAGSANRFYAGESDLLVLHVDPQRLQSPLQEEASSTGEIFPHVYGPLNRDAVTRAEPLTRDHQGHWQFSSS